MKAKILEIHLSITDREPDKIRHLYHWRLCPVDGEINSTVNFYIRISIRALFYNGEPRYGIIVEAILYFDFKPFSFQQFSCCIYIFAYNRWHFLVFVVLCQIIKRAKKQQDYQYCQDYYYQYVHPKRLVRYKSKH